MCKKSFFHFYHLICLLLYVGCIPCPGRKLIPRGEIQPEISIGSSGAVAMGLRYGITDFFNAGASINGLPLSLGLGNSSFINAESYIVLQLLKQKNSRPALNFHSSLIMTIYTFDSEITYYPRFGLTVAYRYKRINPYVTAESFFTTRDKNKYDSMFSVRGGLELQCNLCFSYFFEAGCAGGTTGKGDLVPLVSAGITFSIKEFIKMRRETHLTDY